ncbi:MAG: thioredoxin [Salinivirgaceae bacterium]|jgi:thioredoxin 1
MSTFLLIIIGLVVAFLGLLVFSYYKMKNTPEVKRSEKIKILNPKNMDANLKNNVVLVDFWASWCAPCKMMAPVLNEIAEDDKTSFTVAKVNVEQYQQLATKYKVKNLPTLVLFKNGKEVQRLVGFKNKKAILKEIQGSI